MAGPLTRQSLPGTGLGAGCLSLSLSELLGCKHQSYRLCIILNHTKMVFTNVPINSVLLLKTYYFCFHGIELNLCSLNLNLCFPSKHKTLTILETPIMLALKSVRQVFGL